MNNKVSFLTQLLANNLSSYQSGRYKDYSVYKQLLNIPASELQELYVQLKRNERDLFPLIGLDNTLHLLHYVDYDFSTPITSIQASPEGLSSRSLNRGRNNTLLDLLPDMPDDISFNYVETSSYVGTFYTGNIKDILSASELANNGVCGEPFPINISLNSGSDGHVIEGQTSTYQKTRAIITGYRRDGQISSEELEWHKDDTKRTAFGYSEIISIQFLFHDPSLSVIIRNFDDSNNNAAIEQYAIYNDDRTRYSAYMSHDGTGANVKVLKYASEDPFDFDAGVRDKEQVEYLDIRDTDLSAYSNNIDIINPLYHGDTVFAIDLTNDKLIGVTKSKHTPGAVEEQNVLIKLTENITSNPLLAISKERIDKDSYDFEVFYMRHKEDAHIESYKIILNTPYDNKKYYYDSALKTFVETSLQDGEVSFTSTELSKEFGFYLPTVSTTGLPVGLNYISVYYVREDNTIEHITEPLEIEYRIAQFKSTLSGPLTSTMAINNDSNGNVILVSTDLTDKLNSNVEDTTGANTVGYYADFVYNKYIEDVGNGRIYFANPVTSVVVNGQSIATSSTSINIRCPLDEIGDIYQVKRDEGEKLRDFRKRLIRTVSSQRGTTYEGILNNLTYSLGYKKHKSLNISSSTYSDFVIEIDFPYLNIYDTVSETVPTINIDLLKANTIDDVRSVINGYSGYSCTSLSSITDNWPALCLFSQSNYSLISNKQLTFTTKIILNHSNIKEGSFVIYGASPAAWYANSDNFFTNGNTEAVTVVATKPELSGSGKRVFIDNAAGVIEANFAFDPTMYIQYEYRNDSVLKSSPVYLFDLANDQSRKVSTVNDSYPINEFETYFYNLAKKNIKRWQ